MPRYRMVMLLAALGWAGCSSTPKAAPNTIASSQGMATVVSVAPERWEAVLETSEGRRLAYWTEGTVFLRGQVRLTDYSPPQGARIEYKGLENRGEIWLQFVQVGKE